MRGEGSGACQKQPKRHTSQLESCQPASNGRAATAHKRNRIPGAQQEATSTQSTESGTESRILSSESYKSRDDTCFHAGHSYEWEDVVAFGSEVSVSNRRWLDVKLKIAVLFDLHSFKNSVTGKIIQALRQLIDDPITLPRYQVPLLTLCS